MTKHVRIENADTSTWPVRVTTQLKDADGNWVDQPNPVQLDTPAAMLNDYICSGKRFVIEELYPEGRTLS